MPRSERGRGIINEEVEGFSSRPSRLDKMLLRLQQKFYDLFPRLTEYLDRRIEKIDEMQVVPFVNEFFADRLQQLTNESMKNEIDRRPILDAAWDELRQYSGNLPAGRERVWQCFLRQINQPTK